MKKLISTVSLICLFTVVSLAQVANKQTYLKEFKQEMVNVYSKNRTLNIVFHGHSVPTGYANTPRVNSLHAYPNLTFNVLKSHYQTAVINVITTSIGGEQSEQGAKRFSKEVLNMKPDVLFIDYALNDRSIGLERSEKAWRKMIEKTLKANIKLILMTPTPDLKENILDENAPLAAYAKMIRRLASEYKTGLVDSYALFKTRAEQGENMKSYMAQNNHPDELGHMVVATEILTWFM